MSSSRYPELPFPSPGSVVADTFDLVAVFSVLWKAGWWIAVTTVASFSLAMVIAFSLPKIYVAQGEVVVRAEATVAPDSDRAYNSTAINEAVVATERSVLAADGLLSRVSHEVVFPPALLQQSWISTYVARFLAWSHIREAEVDDTRDMDAVRLAALKVAVGTGVEKGSSVIAVAASTPDPTFSAAVVNHILEDYMQDRVVAQKSVAQNVEVALQARLRQTNERINEVEEHIARLMQQPALIEGTEIPEAQRDLTILRTQLTQARHTVAEKQAAYNAVTQLRNEARGSPARLAELLDDGSQSASELRRQFAQKQQELAGLSARLGSDYPGRIAVQSEVDSLTRRLNGEASRVVAQRKADLDSATQVVESLTTQFAATRSTASSHSSTLLELSRERDSLANLRRIAGAINDRLIAIASQPVDPNARILTHAIPPQLSTYPNKPLIGVIGFVGGFVLSSAVALISAFLKRVRRSVLGQASLFAGPLLGCLPRFRRFGPGRKAGLIETLGLTGADMPERLHVALEGTALELDDAITKGSFNVVAITSALPQEGKSTVAVALALRLARMGQKVLLVHCDLHEGRACYFSKQVAHDGLPARPNIITDPLTKLNILEPPIVRSPASVLHSRDFADMLASARRGYDIILCDTSPVLSVPDALIVARLADAVVLVSEFNRKAGLSEIAELSRRINSTGKPICGVVVTKVAHGDVGYSAYLGYKPARRRRAVLAG